MLLPGSHTRDCERIRKRLKVAGYSGNRELSVKLCAKFAKSRVIKYENTDSRTKFFYYHALLYAYSNYSTNQDVYYVARVNDFVLPPALAAALSVTASATGGSKRGGGGL